MFSPRYTCANDTMKIVLKNDTLLTFLDNITLTCLQTGQYDQDLQSFECKGKIRTLMGGHKV